jgi:hypothetical protein
MRNSNPYRVSVSDGVFAFRTYQDLEYYCSFFDVTALLSPVVGVYDIEVSMFEFSKHDPEQGKRRQADPRVFDTIHEMMGPYFDHDSRVLLYVCDATDVRQKARHRLFNKWFDNKKGFTREELEINPPDCETIYTSIITRNDFPHRDVLQREVIGKAEDLAIEKFGG